MRLAGGRERISRKPRRKINGQGTTIKANYVRVFLCVESLSLGLASGSARLKKVRVPDTKDD